MNNETDVDNGKKYFAYIAIVGQPNVGKSTLLNHLLGVKLSITSKKQQTTRHQILGINTYGNIQIAYIDTPGIHINQKKAMNVYLNRSARSVLFGVNLIVFVITAGKFDEQDKKVLDLIKKADTPTVCVVNKIDRLKDKKTLLPFMQELAEKYSFVEIVPLSALDGMQVKAFEQTLLPYIPQNEHKYEADALTDRSNRFVASEMIREKLTRSLSQELPYVLSVTIESFKDEEAIVRIQAIIWVERKSHKGIVIGEGGAMLKKISTEARLDMEDYFEKKVFLRCWVKVKDSWSDDVNALNDLGYSNS